ncbi:hypothetical protein G9A89_019936 [Geosiphon pyriformis]|nr:hypothetical protein G9A89_019936 [Geosiphon pyriformis]
MTTPYIARLTDFSEEEEETDVHTWFREAQKAIQANNWNDQRAIQTLPFFLKDTANSCDPNAVIQLQNEFNTIKQNTGETVTQYLARFNRIRHQIEAIEQGYYTDPQEEYALPTLIPYQKPSITKIDLKIAVEIPPGIMVQMASRSSLAKKGINVQGGVIDSGYTGNLMVLLQNNSEKPYTIESKEKIAQAIFLPLVKIGKFVPVENREKLSQTTRGTFGFRLTGKGIEEMCIRDRYYTDPQVLNQFIRGLKSSILGRVHPAHPNSLPEAVTLARALESAEKEANHSQMVNMVMEENKTETLEKRVTRLGEELSKKIESYLIPDPRKNTYQPPQRCSQEVSDSRNNRSSCQEFRTEIRACHFCKRVGHLISQCRTRMMQKARENNYYMPSQMPKNQYTPIPCQYPTTYQNQGAYQQQPMIANPNWRPEARNQPMWNQNALVQRNSNRAGTNQQTNPNYQNYQQTYLNIPENLIIGNNDGRNINRTKNSFKLSQTIPPAVATEDSSLTAIFPFELEENETMFKQEQYLAQINTYLCKNCLIPCQSQCCEECQDERDLERKMEIENQQIIPERAHPTDTEFDLRYSEDQSTTLPPRSITKIDLKIAVEIPPGIMVQMASRSSLAKKGINVQGGVIDSGYTGNLMTIPPAVATEDSSLTAIFPFELEENETMFSGAALDEKRPITAMYTEATVNNTPIKLILDSGSAGSIVTLQLVNQLGFKVDRAATSQIITADGSTKLPYGEIDSFPFEINGIVIPTKVLVMDATQYQALVGNDWLTKANATLDWTTQELLINYNAPTKDLPSNLRKIQHYQPSKPISSLGLMTKEQDYQPYQRRPVKKDPNGTRPKLECSVCKKKLSSMTACSTPDEDPRNPTHYYCNHCNKEKYDEEPCLACGEPLPRECDWNDLPGRERTCDTTCQYTILICDWVRGETPFEAAFNRALKRLQHYPHDEDELYNTAQAKSAKVADEVTSYNMFDPVDEFQDYYQQLCPTRQEQEQYLAQINTYLCKNCLIPCQSQCCEECQDERDLERKMEIENQQS